MGMIIGSRKKKGSHGQNCLASQEFTVAFISETGLYKGRQGAHHVGPRLFPVANLILCDCQSDFQKVLNRPPRQNILSLIIRFTKPDNRTQNPIIRLVETGCQSVISRKKLTLLGVTSVNGSFKIADISEDRSCRIVDGVTL